MPKGDNPNSKRNLLKGNRFRKGDTAGKAEAARASNAAQARKRSIEERARIVLDTLINRKNGTEKIDIFSAGCEQAAAQWVKTGDPKYGKALAELAGQLTQKVEQVVITPEVDFDKLNDLRKALKGE